MKKQTVIAIVGPTCTGKTALSIKVANEIGGEIIACDSRTVYRHMDVGTAKPTVAERCGVPHYLFDVADPDHSYTVAQYKNQATDALNDIFSRGLVPIVCGGTGFYARALLEGLVIPEVAPQEDLRKELRDLADRSGNTVLFERLVEVDPVTAQRLNANDRMRVIRAIEVSIVLGKPYSQLVSKCEMPFDIIWIGLNASNRELIRDAIASRFEEQLRLGLFEEVESLYKKYGPVRSLLNSVNYTEFIAYIDGKIDLQQARQDCLKHNNQLARRQLIWFRANPQINWFEFDQFRNSDHLAQSVLQTISEKACQ